jgi:hypothetical protein
MPALIIPKTAVIVSSIVFIPDTQRLEQRKIALHSQKDSGRASDSAPR